MSKGNMYRELYKDVVEDKCSEEFLETFVRQKLQQISNIPMSPSTFRERLISDCELVNTEYASYIDRRNTGKPREMFADVHEARWYLQQVAPTKLVDGAWLSGVDDMDDMNVSATCKAMLKTIRDEETGQAKGSSDHVQTYMKLLEDVGVRLASPAEIVEDHTIPDACFEMGVVQLAIGKLCKKMPAVALGYNLGYEQPVLHLLKTAKELKELKIDPFYFLLHVSVDNAANGHAHLSWQAVVAFLNDTPPTARQGQWELIQNAFALAKCDVPIELGLEHHLYRIFYSKCRVSHGFHANVRSIKDLFKPELFDTPGHRERLFAALKRIKFFERFPRLETTVMPGAFTEHERELIGLYGRKIVLGSNY